MNDDALPTTIICGTGNTSGVRFNYHRFFDQRSSNSEEDGIFYDASCARESCIEAIDLKDRYIAPTSPERAPGSWMLVNAFMLVWSLSLGIYISLLYLWYDGNNAADDSSSRNPTSRETTMDYLLWSLLTTLVWMVEISLRAAFPAVTTVLKVSNSSYDSSSVEDEKGIRNDSDAEVQDNRTIEAKSIVTIEEIVQQRSRNHNAVIAIELILAVFFGIETIFDCYRHWYDRRHPKDETVDPWDSYYNYSEDEKSGGEFYSMLQQQSDIWISVFAYAYMTYETYHAYYRSITNQRDIERSLSTASQGQFFHRSLKSWSLNRSNDIRVTATTSSDHARTFPQPKQENSIRMVSL